MRICFDLDGTLANLYGVDNWLADLRAGNPRPYKEAEVMVNMNTLARRLNQLQRNGHKLVIVSWLSKVSDADYDAKVTEAKKDWLAKHLASVHFDEINIVSYGVNKNNFCESAEDILFDDEEKNRNDWSGRAYNVNNILEVLKEI